MTNIFCIFQPNILQTPFFPIHSERNLAKNRFIEISGILIETENLTTHFFIFTNWIEIKIYPREYLPSNRDLPEWVLLLQQSLMSKIVLILTDIQQTCCSAQIEIQLKEWTFEIDFEEKTGINRFSFAWIQAKIFTERVEY